MPRRAKRGCASRSPRAAFEARIVEASWFGDRSPAVPLGEAFHARRLRLIATQVGAVAPAMRGRRSHAERLAAARSICSPIPLRRAAGRPDALRGHAGGDAAHPRRPGGLCHVITYGTE